MKGKLIVIEGSDGTGKTVQSKKLISYLKSRRLPCHYISYPRYQNSFYGKLVGRFLLGEFGSLESISPYLAAIPYALDRLDQRDEIISWLRKGHIIIANRYVTSSIAHQSAKLPKNKRNKIISFIKQMEYGENKMPQPDLIIYLQVPLAISLSLTKKQKPKINKSVKEDIVEKNINHRKKAHEVYDYLAKHEKNWKIIVCTDTKGSLYPIKTIHKKIIRVIKEKFPLLIPEKQYEKTK